MSDPATAAAVRPVSPGPAPVTCRAAEDADEVAEHHRIRRAVFVGEQRIFEASDVDAHDARADVHRVLAWAGGEPAGTVRFFPLAADGTWQGDRLAVLPGFRTAGVGAPLVRYAVAGAAASGGTTMVAHVQPANRGFFERLGWRCEGSETYVGLPHLVMTIAL